MKDFNRYGCKLILAKVDLAESLMRLEEDFLVQDLLDLTVDQVNECQLF